jgi:hypothetical protein
MNKINIPTGKRRTFMSSRIKKKNHVNRFVLVHGWIRMLAVLKSETTYHMAFAPRCPKSKIIAEF